MVAHALHKSKTPVKFPFIQIIKKQAAHAARFVPVRQEKILVAPFFIERINSVAERQAGGAGSFMPVQDIVCKRIKRRQIKTAAEPPDGGRAGFLGD